MLHSAALPVRTISVLLGLAPAACAPGHSNVAAAPPPPATVQHPAPEVASSTPPARPAVEPGCFDVPITLTGKGFGPKPVDHDPDTALGQCRSAEDPAQCRFNVARDFFDANRFEVAGPIFRQLALDTSGGDASYYACQLFLECLNVIGIHAEPPRPACYEQMAEDVPSMIAAHCEAGPRHQPDELCPLLDKILADIARLWAENLVRRADGLEREDERAPLYLQGAEAYMALFSANCRLDKAGKNSKGRRPGDIRCDELIYNAYRAFQAGKDSARAEAARRALLDPQNKLDRSPLARKVAQEQ